LELIESGGGRGETSNRDKPTPPLNAMLVQPEYFPDSPSDLISGNRVANTFSGNDPDSRCLIDFPP
jgi:hypothetical protein